MQISQWMDVTAQMQNLVNLRENVYSTAGGFLPGYLFELLVVIVLFLRREQSALHIVHSTWTLPLIEQLICFALYNPWIQTFIGKKDYSMHHPLFNPGYRRHGNEQGVITPWDSYTPQ